MNTEITKNNLLKNGWIEGEDFYMEKPIANVNPINADPEDTGIKLILHSLYNGAQFAIAFPNGALLNFNVGSIEELNAFENRISFYDSEY